MNGGKDIVIVGSGLGGLVCGAILSKEGYRVTVLEANRQIGGTLQVFAREKHLFDSAIHYVGGMGPGQNLYKVFKYLGIMDDLRIEKLDEEAFDKIVFIDEPRVEYPLAQGYDRFVQRLSEKFPDEQEAIRKYCDLIELVCSKFPLYHIKEGDPMEKLDYMGLEARTCIAEITHNKRLQQVLAGNNMLYAGVGDKSPFYMHALIQNSYIEGSYRFMYGGSQLAKLLAKRITESGGRVIKRARVVRFHVENGKVAWVETVDGSKYPADFFISNAHPMQTLAMTDTEMIRPAYRKRVRDLENTISTFILNLTLKPGIIPYQRSNYYCILNDDVWTGTEHSSETWPLVVAIYFSPQEKNKDYAEGLTMVTYMNYGEVEKWKDSFNTVAETGERGSDYEEFKQEKSERLISIADQVLPGLRNAISQSYSSTPLTFRDYIGTEDGSLYGIMKDYRDTYKSMLSHRTRVPNLFLTGQNLNLHGVLGVTISSLVTCTAFIELGTLIRKIEDAQQV